MYIVKTGNAVKKFSVKCNAMEYFKNRLVKTIKNNPYLTGLEKMSVIAAIDGFMYRFRSGIDNSVNAFGIELKSE
jgi:hypothetical protein